MWLEFDAKLKDYLLSINGEFADPSSFSYYDLPTSSDQNPPTEYHNLPWLFLVGGKLNRERRKLMPANPATFSPRTLCSIGSVWRKPAPGVQPLVLIGMRSLQID